MQVLRICFDVLFPILTIYMDMTMVIGFYTGGENLYALATLCIMLIPGFLEFLNSTMSMINGDFAGPDGKGWRTYVYWIGFSAVYPVSTIIWHVYHLSKGMRHFNRFEVAATSAVLNSISQMTKAPLQMVLQTTVLMLEWYHHNGFYHVYQPVSIGVSLLFLAKHETDHFFFEISGKDVNATFPYRKATKKFLFNLYHISVRVACISILCAYLKVWQVVFCAAMVASLFILASCTMNTYVKKNFFTSFAGIVVPSGAFLSRETFLNRYVAEARFRRFARGNALIFAVLTAVAMFTCMLLIQFNPGNCCSITCDNIPPLSYNHAQDCPNQSPIKDLSKMYLAPHQDDLDHRWLVLMFLPLGAALIVHVVLVWLE
eukprot:TRINITY_DN6077_c0_g1_i1.p1 TRINITY_DN6077_c0_g1~~TRINITY_DN6077_c0_g1_i1.p1  ORF type:complete len:392 (-),score=28.86 TRINITY_DN6077_c0_g1_i1:64-1182(-)